MTEETLTIGADTFTTTEPDGGGTQTEPDGGTPRRNPDREKFICPPLLAEAGLWQIIAQRERRSSDYVFDTSVETCDDETERSA
ncbi:MAG TPA: hypothetical protein VLS88_15890 [Polyangiales bacterium]|nr:hypothetical protein [Polyangiales bacterium]